MSEVGARAMASTMGGGDHDGDIVISELMSARTACRDADARTVIWNKKVVEPFEDAAFVNGAFVDPGQKMLDASNYFEQSSVVHEDRETVKDFVASLPPDGQARQDALQGRILAPLLTERFHGQYSIYHTLAAYTLGIGHEDTVRLAHIAALGLDAPKLGLTIRPEVLKADKRRWAGLAMPEYYQRAKPRENRHPEQQPRALRRDPQLGPHILDLLMRYNDEKVDACLTSLQNLREKYKPSSFADADLDAPWMAFRKAAKDDVDEGRDVRTIETFVGELNEAFGVATSAMARQRQSSSQSRDLSAAASSAEPAPAPYDEVISRFHKGLTSESPSIRSRVLRRHPDLLARLKASCAYCFGGHDGKHFPFTVAFANLCAIKKAAVDGDQPAVSFVNEVAGGLAMDKRLVSVPDWNRLSGPSCLLSLLSLSKLTSRPLDC